MKLPPHKFLILGKPWTMRWGLPPGTRLKELFDPKRDLGSCIPHQRLIVLNPSLRSSPALAWETFVHEVSHALGRALKVPDLMNHGIIKLMERGFGYFLMENMGRVPVSRPR